MNLDLDCEYIVVGSGIAGLRAAVDLAQAGRVLIITKAEISESNSAYAQGGIAAAIGQNDSVEQHYADTMSAGAGLGEPEAVRVLVEDGPAEIARLVAWGADFDKEGQALSLGREGGHSVPRIVHGNGGLTGRTVIEALLVKVRSSSNVKILPFTFLRDFLVDSNKVVAVRIQHDGRVIDCHGKSILIATGGSSQVYRETTNPGTATGDGLAAAYRAGVPLRDMEFVQFHPTALNLPGAPRFLLTEALRGQGARILDERGERFVDELKTRDEVSRAIYRRQTEEKDTQVFLDVTHLPEQIVRKTFGHVYRTCLQYGLDITRQRIPITPAAHYFMGGIQTDLSGRTSLRALYAAGEVASSGVHGANRLASNSLLEALVFGGRTAKAMCEDQSHETPPQAHVVSLAHQPSPEHCALLHNASQRIREITWRYAGVSRNAKGLQTGGNLLRSIDEELSQTAATSDDITIQNLSTVARIIHETALARTESRGAHYRADFPDVGETALHSYIRKGHPVSFR